MNTNQNVTTNNQVPGSPNAGIDSIPAPVEFAQPDNLASECELRVLLVDDHDDMLSMMHLLMTRRNFEVQTANTPFKALELMAGFSPHIVVSDIGMPDMDGYELMQKLRGLSSSPFKAIALTGFDLEDDRELARAAGYDAHLAKPIDFNLLFELISRLAAQPAD